jgi:hypothetical protein
MPLLPLDVCSTAPAEPASDTLDTEVSCAAAAINPLVYRTRHRRQLFRPKHGGDSRRGEDADRSEIATVRQTI